MLLLKMFVCELANCYSFWKSRMRTMLKHPLPPLLSCSTTWRWIYTKLYIEGHSTRIHSSFVSRSPSDITLGGCKGTNRSKKGKQHGFVLFCVNIKMSFTAVIISCSAHKVSWHDLKTLTWLDKKLEQIRLYPAGIFSFVLQVTVKSKRSNN